MPARATVEVFQASVGRRVVGNRRIARFTARRRSFTWSGARARNGLLFARFRVRVARGSQLGAWSELVSVVVR